MHEYKRWLFLPMLLFILVPTALVYSAMPDGKASFQKWQKQFNEVDDAVFRLTLQNRVKGRLLPQEVVKVSTIQSGALYAKWIGKRHKGRESLYVPGWNDNEVWVKEGGRLDYSAVSTKLDDPLVKLDYRRTFDMLLPAAMMTEFEKWFEHSEVESQPGLMRLVHADGRTLTWKVRKAGFSLTVKDAKERLLESYAFDNIKLNTGLTADYFKPTNPAFSFPGYSPKGIFVDPDKQQKNLIGFWSTIRDYRAVLKKRERIKGKMQPMNTIAIKFRKPCDIYAKWLADPHEGREVLYRQELDGEKLLVKESGLLGIKPVRLGLDSRLVKGDTNHRLTEMDLGYALRIIHENLVAGQKNNDTTMEFQGMEFIDGRRVSVVKTTVNSDARDKYYAPVSIIGHDMETGLPVKIVSIDAQGEVFEEFIWTKLRLNVGLTDADFAEDNEEYGF